MGRNSLKSRTAVDPHVQQLITTASGASLEPTQATRLTSLWAGYGSILEVAATDEEGKVQRLIVKEVAPPPHETGVGHDRKLHSYQACAGRVQARAMQVMLHGHCNKHLCSLAGITQGP
jgi:hypothetical protein